MTSRGKASPFLTTMMSALFAVGFLVPALPAHADIEPPFVVGFPQDTQTTVFSSTYGAHRSGGRRHQGNDLMAPKLTHVYAVADGIVTVIDTASGAGRYVELEHRSGWSTRYMHLNNDDPGTDNGRADWSLTVVAGLEVGSRVTAGQHIGYVGDSGNAEWTGSHTHFELDYQGRVIDPFPILKKAYARAEALRSGAARGAIGLGDTQLS